MKRWRVYVPISTSDIYEVEAPTAADARARVGAWALMGIGDPLEKEEAERFINDREPLAEWWVEAEGE